MQITELKPEYLIPYLPHSLKVNMEGTQCNVAWMSTKNIAVIRPDGIGEYKKIPWKRAQYNIAPNLRPLSDLTEEITKRPFVMMKVLCSVSAKEEDQFDLDGTLPDYWKATLELLKRGDYKYLEYWQVQMLLKYHFDVFGLIQPGFAIILERCK